MLGFLIINVIFFCVNNSLQVASEGPAPVDDALGGHAIPLLIHRGLEGINIGVANSTGPGLNLPPESKVQGVGIRGVWRPELLGPEWDVGLQPLLGLLGGVGGGAILLEDHVHVWVVVPHPREAVVLQDLDATCPSEPVPSGEPVEWRGLSIRGHKPQGRDAGRVLGGGQGADSLIHITKAQVAVILAVLHGVDHPCFFITENDDPASFCMLEIMQKSLATVGMFLFHGLCQEGPLHPHKTLSPAFFTVLLIVVSETSKSLACAAIVFRGVASAISLNFAV